MSARPAAVILRRSARVLYEEAQVIKRSYSVGGVGRIWLRGAREHERRYQELVSLSTQLKLLSGALSRAVTLRRLADRAVLTTSDEPKLEVRP